MRADFERIALGANPDAVVITAVTGEVLHWNAGAESTLGYTAGDALGQSMRRLFVPENQHDDYRRIVATTLRKGNIVYELVCRRKDGTLIHVDGTCKVIRAAPGETEYLLFAQKDITCLRVARQAQALAQGYGELLEAMPDGIVLVNPTGQIVRANTRAETMFGYERGELQGTGVECLLPERSRAEHRRRRAEYFANPRHRPMGSDLELWGVRKNGSEFPVELSLDPLRTEDGLLAICAIRDITERKRVELVLASKNLELERVRGVRLQKSLSHALRTRLNSIIGFSGTLLMQLPGPLTPEQRQQISVIKASAHDLLDVLDEALGVRDVTAEADTEAACVPG